MPALAAAGISAGGSLLGGITGGKGASKAASAQAQAEQNAINLQQQEFQTTQNNIQPTVQIGTTASERMAQLLGLGDTSTYASGNQAQLAQQQQQATMAGITSSPLYTGAFNSGLDALSQTQAASGGVRGGNSALSDSNFGANLFSSVYQQMLSNLSGLANTGSSAASSLGQIGQNSANATSNLMTQQGNANAVAAASPYAAFQQALSGIGQAAGSYFGGTGTGSGTGYISAANPYTAPYAISTTSGYTPSGLF